MGHGRENDAREAKLGRLVREFTAALLSADEVAAEAAIRQAIADDMTTAQIDEEIIAPALWLVGELWERGEISVAEEHIATEICMRVLALQREARRLARERRGHRIMLATPEGEMHTVALHMVGELLREAAYDVVMLGADVPAQALAASASRLDPAVVCLSSTMPGGSDQVLIAIHEVQRQCPRAGYLIGGRGLTSRVRALTGIDVVEWVSGAVEAVDALVKRAHLN
jgi:MerR family transcriptional regulator, light-induced transcriptional regulator